METLIEYLKNSGSEYKISSDDVAHFSKNYEKLEMLEPISNNIVSLNGKFYEKNEKTIRVGEKVYTVISYDDVTKYALEIKKSKIDCLTKLPNRTQIERYLSKINSECIIVMSDIDDFKRVNDVYGHQTGDTVISLVGEFIRSLIEKENFAGRYGGEEFLIVFNSTDVNEVKLKMDNFNEILKKLTKPLNISVSTGIYKYNPSTERIDAAVRKADEALYYVKHNGKSAAMIYDEVKMFEKNKTQ